MSVLLGSLKITNAENSKAFIQYKVKGRNKYIYFKKYSDALNFERLLKKNMKKGEVFNGKSVTINSDFRVYDSFLDSAKDYIKFLQTNPRYTKYGVFKAKDYKEQVQAIKNAGYATGTNYVSAVLKIVSGITDDIALFTVKNKTPIGVGALLIIAGLYYMKTKNLLQ